MNNMKEEWKVEEIGNVCEIHDSKRIPLNAVLRRERKGKYPYYGANNIQDFIDDFIFNFPSVLLAEDGGYYDEYESRDIAQYATGEYWVNNHAHILTGRDCLDTKFLYYLLVRKNICPWINTGTRSKLNQADLRKIKIALPPLLEQQKITSILTSVDDVIRSTQKQIKKLQYLKTGTLNELMTKGLDHIEFKESELGKIPKSWEVLNFSQIIQSANQGVNTTTENVTYSCSGIKACRSNNIDENSFNWNDKKFVNQSTFDRLTDKFKPKLNDVLYCNIGSNLGAAAVVETSGDFMITWNVLRITPKNSKVSPYFLSHSLNSLRQELRDFATESTMPFISSKALSKFKFKIPPLNEQKKISAVIEGINNNLEILKLKIHQTQSLKKSLMQDLLSGTVRVQVKR